MRFRQALPVALASSVRAQSLADALASQNSSLSVLNGLLASQPELLSTLGLAKNVTILAPNNDALNKLLNNTAEAASIASDPGVFAALLTYHVLNGTYYASNFTNTSSTFVTTTLTNTSYVNVTGGQRIQALVDNGSLTFFSGLKENSTVKTPNVNFTGGTIHVIDSVLTIPPNDTVTLEAANLTSAVGALQKANVTQNLTQLSDVTIFVPTNEAFSAISNVVANLTSSQLSSILQYHVIAGQVDYSTLIHNSSVPTLGGGNVTFTVENGTVWVNSAKIIESDVLVNNGVVHVIDNVLNPQNTTATPNPTASANPPAFSGASTSSSSGGVPFTSGVPAPTSTAPVATAGGRTSTSSGLGVPMRTGAVGAAALFGGAAMLVNL